MELLIHQNGLGELIKSLQSEGFLVVGPVVREGAIVYDEIRSIADLPLGLKDVQSGGKYRLEPRSDKALFGYAVGPHSWKKYLFPPFRKLWEASRSGKKLSFTPAELKSRKTAFLGIRACEIAALKIQDKVFMGQEFQDPFYQKQRGELCLIAVNCHSPAETCFCASQNTGPHASSEYDICVTEFVESDEYLCEANSELGKRVLGRVTGSPTTSESQKKKSEQKSASEKKMGRTLDLKGLAAQLVESPNHPRWNDVATRCLSCANCTMVCPTCFCSSVEEKSDLDGSHAERWKHWDSCFNVDFSYVHGGSVRSSVSSRYRQWLTHKLSTWHDQFGTSGCVGCGRCITWCPVGIDLTEEAKALTAVSGDRP